MEKNLTVFENEEFGKVRTIEIDGEIWFVGVDVAKCLGYTNPRKAIRDHVDAKDRKNLNLNTVTIRSGIHGNPNVTIINESGMYSLILSSKLDSAKRFKHWVTSEILPSIRKNGFYATENFLNNSDQLLDFAPEILIKIANEMKKSTEKKKDLRDKIPIADQQILLMLDSMQKELKMQQEKIEELQAEVQKFKEAEFDNVPF